MSSLQWILLLGLMILNGFLTMARAALVNVRKARLRQLVEEGVGTARTAERLAEDSSRLLATTQLGMMLTSVFAGAVVAISVAPLLSGALDPWLADSNKWVRRAGVTAVGRLPLVYPSYTKRCVAMAQALLYDPEVDVRRAVSFALRLCARGDPEPVRQLLERNVPPDDTAATWVLCDVVRSMTKTLLPHFRSVMPLYEEWSRDPELSARERRSVESAVKVLGKAGV